MVVMVVMAAAAVATAVAAAAPVPVVLVLVGACGDAGAGWCWCWLISIIDLLRDQRVKSPCGRRHAADGNDDTADMSNQPGWRHRRQWALGRRASMTLYTRSSNFVKQLVFHLIARSSRTPAAMTLCTCTSPLWGRQGREHEAVRGRAIPVLVRCSIGK